MTPVVSIIIPTYNREKDLKRALNSVLAQTFSSWQAIVVDNYSSDNTEDLVISFNDSRIKLFKIRNEGVIAMSRNLGIKHAEGKYIAFLDSDDWWLPNKLEVSLQYLERGADLIYHDLFIVTKLHQKFFWRIAPTRHLKSPVFDDLIINGNTLNNSSVVVRKHLLDKVNGLSEDVEVVGWEDYDVWLKISNLSENFKKIPQTLGYYWRVGGNTGNPPLRLRCYAAMEERYADAMSGLSGNYIYWLNYNKGLQYYLLENYEMAKKYFGLVCLNKVPLYICVSVCRFLLLIKCATINNFIKQPFK